MKLPGFDAWKTREEPLEDAPLHTHCAECNVRLRDYFEEVKGLCEDCEAHDNEICEQWLGADEEAA